MGRSSHFWQTSDHKSDPTHLEIPLLGDHQVENAATAYVTLQTIKEAGIIISEDTIREGMAETSWAGKVRNSTARSACDHRCRPQPILRSGTYETHWINIIPTNQ